MVNKLQIIRIDNLAVQKVDLQIGENIIGRGIVSGNVDNPNPEHALTICLEPTGELTLTPKLACYMKCSSLGYWRSLNIGSTVPIKPGDICSILPDRSWFKIMRVDSTEKMDDSDSRKRKATIGSEEESPNKKPKKLQNNNSIETIHVQNKSSLDSWDSEEGKKDPDNTNSPSAAEESNTSLSKNPSVEEVRTEDDKNEAKKNANEPNASSSNNETENRDEAGKKIKWDCGRHFSDQTGRGSGETSAEEKEPDSANEENNENAEPVPAEEPPRNKCAYGSRCYRRDSEHKKKFSHPGDPDYDITDDRPECRYGIRCYRKNPQHKLDFKHTRIRPSRNQTPIRGVSSDATSGTDQSSAEESVDESSYEPSNYDPTSDEYRSDLDDLSDFDAVSDVDDK